MTDEKRFHRRANFLIGAYVLCLALFTGILYNAQIVNGSEYLARSTIQVTTTKTVETSRGIITDRNGKILVSNREIYTVSFDPDLVPDQDGETHQAAVARALLRILTLFQDHGVTWGDSLPIGDAEPYGYTFAGATGAQRAWFSHYLADRKWSSTELTASSSAPLMSQTLLDKLKLTGSTALTAPHLLELMRADFGVPTDFSRQEARLVLGIQYELYLRRLVNTVAYILAEDIDMEFISLINDGGYSGAKVISSYAREIETSSASHILGMVGPIYAEDDLEALRAKGYNGDDTIGRSGAEAAFEDYLRGTDGRRVVSVNSDGKITGEYYTRDPKPGNNVELTIDLKFQQAAEEALASTVSAMSEKDGNTTRGAGLAVVKVGTGEVLALVSYPNYDLSAYIQDSTYRAKLNTDESRPLMNRATTGRYSPGSTYKPMIAVAALEEGVVTLTEKILDTGYWRYPDIVAGTGEWGWWCWNRGGHGRLNVTQAVTASCNTFFYEMGYRLGIEKIEAYADAFGFGKSTGIEIGDNPGLVAGPEEKEARGEIWYGGDTVQAAIGQGHNLFTPLQIANYMATLVSGGDHYDAHLLKTAKTYDNSQVVAVGNQAPTNVIPISESTLDAVKAGMHDLTKTTLAPYFNSCVVSAGAKTGTAQLGANITNNGVFVCFAPYEEPEIAVALVIEQGNSGARLASTAVEVINAYFTPDEAETVITGENQLLP